MDPFDGDNPGAHVYIDTIGERCVIQFKNYPEFQAQAGDVVNAEVVLYPNGAIKFQYLSIAAGFDLLSSTVGIENPAGNDGLNVVYHADYLHSNLAIQFYQPYEWLNMSAMAGEVPPGGADTIVCKFTSEGLDTGTYEGELLITSNDPDNSPWSVSTHLRVTSEPPYLCGDASGDTKVNVSDAVYIINYVFVPGSPGPDPFEAGDASCDTKVNVSDAVYIINYVFVPGSPAPCANCR
jgi:hypothetical protein